MRGSVLKCFFFFFFFLFPNALLYTCIVCSGAVHAKHQINVTAANSYTISGEFSAPTAKGTWPAFW